MPRFLTAIVALLACANLCAAQETGLLKLTEVRRLNTRRSLFPGGPLYFSAASGLVKYEDLFYVVADDAQVLGWFRGEAPGDLRRIFHRPPLPEDMEIRKKIKPDLECLTLVPHGSGTALLTLGSGSGEHRYSGALVPMGWYGESGRTTEFDIRPLYRALEKRFPELNIEGVSVLGDRLRLLQRGNGTTGPNALIDLDFAAFHRLAAAGKPVDDSVLVEIIEVDLGTIPGPRRPVRWTFSDLCPLPGDRCLFSAAAEDTDNPYDDGEILGSAIGVLEADGTVSSFRKVDLCIKIEGIAVDQDIVYAVTDGDDPAKPASLYRTRLW